MFCLEIIDLPSMIGNWILNNSTSCIEAGQGTITLGGELLRKDSYSAQSGIALELRLANRYCWVDLELSNFRCIGC
jgi:hypothetical protein